MNDWIVIDQTVSPWVIRCKRCGAVQELPQTMAVDIFRAIGDTFTKAHKGCTERPAGRDQLDVVQG